MHETVVYKLGGSLFTLPDLARRLQRAFELPLPRDDRPPAGAEVHRLLVVGGGPTADVVRHWDQVHALGDERSHELAMRSMSFNAHFVAALLGNAVVVADRKHAQRAWESRQIAVLAAAEFVAAEELATHDRLPRAWNVTADSVAAYIALHWPARTLVLIKSVPTPRQSASDDRASDAVDASFPEWGARIRQLGWVNLRTAEPTMESWTVPRRSPVEPAK